MHLTERVALARRLCDSNLEADDIRSAIKYALSADNLTWLAADKARRMDPTWRPGDRWETMPTYEDCSVF